MMTSAFDFPSQLCNWSIHYDDSLEYNAIDSLPDSPTDDDGDQFDVEDETTWRGWAGQDQARILTDTITDGLKDNSFSRIESDELPFTADRIVDAIAKSPTEADIEAVGFAIMSRNVATLDNLLENRRNPKMLSELHNISPFHLAARFLDGSRACCGVIMTLVEKLDDKNSIGVNYTDSSKLTVL